MLFFSPSFERQNKVVPKREKAPDETESLTAELASVRESLVAVVCT